MKGTCELPDSEEHRQDVFVCQPLRMIHDDVSCGSPCRRFYTSMHQSARATPPTLSGCWKDVGFPWF